MRQFLSAPSGRAFFALNAFAAISAALIGLAGASAPAAAIPMVTLVCIAAGILTVGLAVAEFEVAGLLVLFALAAEVTAYFPALHVVGDAGIGPILTLFAFGLAALALAVTGGLPRRASPALAREQRAPLAR